MKKYFYFAAAALALASCASDDFVGENPEGGETGKAISLDGGTGAITRAVKQGKDAATALNNNFVVYGYKTTGSTSQKVYDHYTVNYVDGTALSTPSNSAGWEYVGQTLNMLTSLVSGAVQEIKYWDQAAGQYDFVAFSTGTATQVKTDAEVTTGKVCVAAINNTPTYTINGAVADLAKCYISDRVTAKKGVEAANKIANRLIAYKDAVQFNFRSLGSKARIGLYETIPGYSVTAVKFYDASGNITDASQKPTLYASAENIPGGTGTMTITFPTTDNTKTDYNKAHVAFTGGTNTKNLTFSEAITLKAAEKKEATGNVYLGREASNASLCAYETILPATAGDLTLKVDYTLLSTDGSGETIEVKGATAVVPAEYCTWQPNYAYTYLFKITDNTNGEIGGEVGLYPVTFDAVVTETEDGIQETITTVATPSITTYAKGAVNNEYYKSDNIYVKVNGATLSTDNSKLYTVTVEAGAAQGITEESVANCIKNGTYYVVSAPTGTGSLTADYYTTTDGVTFTACTAGTDPVAGTTYYKKNADGTYTVKDALAKTMTVTKATETLSIATEIAAADAPDGNAVSGNFAKFTPECTTDTYYVFEYTDGTNKHYKIIKVAGSARS